MRFSSYLQQMPWFGLVGCMFWIAMAPPNDDCIDAEQISSFPFTFSGTTIGASDSNTSGTPAECHPFPASSGGVWFELAGTGGTMLATTCMPGTSFDTRLAVYASGSSPGDCTGLVCVTANDDIGIGGGCAEMFGNTFSQVEWSTTPGLVYYLYLDGFGTTTGNFELFVEETIPAPLTLTRFEGRMDGDRNLIYWETINESNTEWHLIERSASGRDNWQLVEKVEAAGFSHLLETYEVADTRALRVGYYRLRTIDYDRSVHISPIIRMERAEGGFQLQRIAPVPFADYLEIQFETDRNGMAHLELFDLAGKQVFEEELRAENGGNQLRLDLQPLKAGIYLLKIEQEGRRVIERIVKEKF